MLILHQVKENNFKDQSGKEVSFLKAIYETDRDVGCAILKGSSEKLGIILNGERPFEIENNYDIVRQEGKMPRLYIL